LLDVTLNALIAFVVTFLLSAVVRQLALPSGRITIGEIMEIGQRRVGVLDVANLTKDPISGLRLVAPRGVRSSDITTSVPITVRVASDSAANGTLVVLDDLPPYRLSRVHVALDRVGAGERLQVLNAESKRLRVEHDESQTYDLWSVVRDPLIQALITAVLSSIAVLIMARLTEGLRAEAQKARGELKSFGEQSRHDSEGLRARIKELEGNTGRLRIVMVARLSDCMKELGFWRDTVRQLLYKMDESGLTAERLVQEITRTLKTYAAQDRMTLDYEAIEALAGVVRRSPQQ
jgi:hypothetical protein